MAKAYEKRFWPKVNKNGPVSDFRPDLGQCWLWTASKDGRGYGRFRFGGRTQYAHRIAYEWLVGPIPGGLGIDHLCRVHNCVNPAHLEPVTQRENILRGNGVAAQHVRKTHCLRGHPLSGENLYVTPCGWRACLACKRECDQRRRARRRAA